MTSPITAQGPGTQAMHQTPFPPPFGLEQYLGPQWGGQQMGPQWGGQQQGGQLYGGQQFPGQLYGGQQQGGQQMATQQMVAQLLPFAYQVILPQVLATAAQQIQQYVQYLVSQQSGSRPWGF